MGKKILIGVGVFIVLFVGLVWLINSTSGEMTEPIRQEFARRPGETFQIGESEYGSDRGAAIVTITNAQGVSRLERYYLIKKENEWAIERTEPYTLPVPEPKKEDEPERESGIVSVALIPGPNAPEQKEGNIVIVDSDTDYYAYIKLDKPLTERASVKHSYKKTAGGGFMRGTSTKSVKPENPPRDYVEISLADTDNERFNPGTYESTFSVGGSSITVTYRVQ